MKKVFLRESEVIEDAFRLGLKIFESGFRPSFIVGLWRGGSAAGIYVQECLQTLGVETNHIAIRTSYRGQQAYQHMIENPEEISVHGLQFLSETLNADDRLLIVDDVFSTGYNVEAVLNRLTERLKRNTPKDIRIATIWRRPDYQKTKVSADFFIRDTEDWLVFPYELAGLSVDEIAEHKAYVLPYLREKYLHPAGKSE